MKNGNASLCGWVYLFVLLLGVLPAVGRAQTVALDGPNVHWDANLQRWAFPVSWTGIGPNYSTWTFQLLSKDGNAVTVGTVQLGTAYVVDGLNNAGSKTFNVPTSRFPTSASLEYTLRMYNNSTPTVYYVAPSSKVHWDNAARTVAYVAPSPSVPAETNPAAGLLSSASKLGEWWPPIAAIIIAVALVGVGRSVISKTAPLVVAALLTLAGMREAKAAGTFTVGTGTDAVTFSYDYISGSAYIYNVSGPGQYTWAVVAGGDVNQGTGIYAGMPTATFSSQRVDIYQNPTHVGGGLELQGTLDATSGAWTSAKQNHALTVKLTVKNNVYASQTITVGNATPQTIPGQSSQTLTFVASGPMGTGVPITSNPGAIVIEGVQDPLVIGGADATVTRSAHIGAATAVKTVQILLMNWYGLTVPVTVKLDGVAIGTLEAKAASQPTQVGLAQFAFSLEMSSDSMLTFTAGSQHSCQSSATFINGEAYYTVRVDEGAEWHNVTQNSSGTTTVTSTDPTTGTTSIQRVDPVAPSNSNTSPTGALGGAVSTSATGGTYNNTSTSAGSAATQDAANSLAQIQKDIATARSVLEADKADRDTNLTSDGKASVKSLLSGYADGSAATNAFDAAQARAGNAQMSAAQAVANKIGTPSASGVQEPTKPTPGSIELKIGMGKTVTMHLNPFDPDGPLGGIVATAAAFIKRLIAWALVSWFFYEIMKEIRTVCSRAYQTGGYNSELVAIIKDVNIFGWTVGAPVAVGVRLVLVTLIVTAVLTLPAAALAAAEGGLPWSELVSIHRDAAAATSGSGSVLTAIGYADYVLPWRLMMSLPLYYILVQNVLFPLEIFWMSIFKFLP